LYKGEEDFLREVILSREKKEERRSPPRKVKKGRKEVSKRR